MYITVQYYKLYFLFNKYFIGLSSHCAYDLLERRLHNLNEKDYSEVQTLVQVGKRLVSWLTKPGEVGDFFALVSIKSPNFCQKKKF